MRDKIWMVVFVLILGSVWTTALVGVDKYTAPYIEKHEKEKLCLSVLSALSLPCEKENAEEVFSGNIETVLKGERIIYRAKNGDIAFKVSGSGAQGPIAGVVALQPDLNTIRGITIVHQEETPGLGDRVFEDETLARFKGKQMQPPLVVKISGSVDKNNEVEGITGATLTCKAFEKILNTGVKEYVSLLSEGN
jgi:Na+-transporting NADH:ubiquinone oxidoreductase subunit C